MRGGVPEHGRVPRYYAVRTSIEGLLEHLPEGGPLPTERELAERFGAARETVRQAVRDLLLQGRLRRRGRGTVAAGPKLAQPLALRSYTEGVRRGGQVPGRTLVALERRPAGPELGAALAVGADAAVWHLERVLLADGERVGLESVYVPVARFPGLDRGFDPGASFSAYARREAGVRFGAAEERLETLLATPREALLVGTPPALPMLLVNRVSRDTAGVPVEHVRALYRGDRFRFTAELHATPEVTDE
ncbi:GntR family transcriptional regulator [Nocardiopsis suaedae]|uniref:GntR family transcriptional regulator n=1 Tax=Nocardiopsis suaedae TaxID=3018444 RepID=A0ABT4TSG4_9ACTN|nr:GntR family transcriptional regulator [Nocardiopsis suaedae]MDA2807087.1 GntR family transcriptional regulator [Nocardiopsis suaedae]